jgi:hypothetical protein
MHGSGVLGELGAVDIHRTYVGVVASAEMYKQRYVPHFPAAGEVVIFDRSWYNRAGVQRVMGCDLCGGAASSSVAR